MKYALVTGGTKGIGKATVENLLEKGFYVFINYAHNKEVASSMEKELLNRGFTRYTFVQADLSNMDGIEKIAKLFDNNSILLDTIILNVGVTDYAAFGNVSLDIWNYIVNTNLTIPFFLLQTLRDKIAEAGSITLISSVMGNYPHGRSIPYGVSKIGIIYLAKMLVKEFCDKRIRVNAISPGFTETEMQREKTEDHRKRITEKLALHRFAEPDEIADMICAVIDNTYINGANIEIDGGYSYF